MKSRAKPIAAIKPLMMSIALNFMLTSSYGVVAMVVKKRVLSPLSLLQNLRPYDEDALS